MATLVLGALGTAVGGPVGGALGAMLGRQVDASIAGTSVRDGPRLKDLAVTTSSYGQPIARHFGSVRAPGIVIWSGDIEESSETSGGGKGRPKTREYSYSVSFAVALSSRPIDRLGRIWADGNLLRGAAGDLKTGGSLRVHTGHDDQGSDPLLRAVLGNECSAHRGCAYVVFENLSLADFGNRLPALSFEIFARSASQAIAALLEDTGARASAIFPRLGGFSYDGGSLASALVLMDRLEPLVATTDSGAIRIANAPASTDDIPTLPEPVSWDDGEFGRDTGVSRARRVADRAPSALRYYDRARDYQPSLQRVDGAGGSADGPALQFPGVFDSGDAKALIGIARARSMARRETLAWRCAELDPAIAPGCLVRAPGNAGIWQVAAWEWREAGVELQLTRHIDLPTTGSTGDAGNGWLPPDRLPPPSMLRMFELPWDGSGSSERIQVYAAASAPSGPWSGATLYADRQGALVPVGEPVTRRATGGVLAEPLGPGSALRFEPLAEMRVLLHHEDAGLASVDIDALARGANRLLVGDEILQFASGEPYGGGSWTLRGLLRGRGGTEAAALAGHGAGAAVTLLDERLVALPDNALAQSSGGRFAALGLGDETPASATLENAGISRQPPFPVHGRAQWRPDGSLFLTWTRRARGGWAWLDQVDQPLVEQQERYEAGLGPVTQPIVSWSAATPALALDATTVAQLVADHPGQPVWVRQIGSFARSKPLLLATLPANI